MSFCLPQPAWALRPMLNRGGLEEAFAPAAAAGLEEIPASIQAHLNALPTGSEAAFLALRNQLGGHVSVSFTPDHNPVVANIMMPFLLSRLSLWLVRYGGTALPTDTILRPGLQIYIRAEEDVRLAPGQAEGSVRVIDNVGPTLQVSISYSLDASPENLDRALSIEAMHVAETLVRTALFLPSVLTDREGTELAVVQTEVSDHLAHLADGYYTEIRDYIDVEELTAGPASPVIPNHLLALLASEPAQRRADGWIAEGLAREPWRSRLLHRFLQLNTLMDLRMPVFQETVLVAPFGERIDALGIANSPEIGDASAFVGGRQRFLIFGEQIAALQDPEDLYGLLDQALSGHRFATVSGIDDTGVSQWLAQWREEVAQERAQLGGLEEVVVSPAEVTQAARSQLVSLLGSEAGLSLLDIAQIEAQLNRWQDSESGFRFVRTDRLQIFPFAPFGDAIHLHILFQPGAWDPAWVDRQLTFNETGLPRFSEESEVRIEDLAQTISQAPPFDSDAQRLGTDELISEMTLTASIGGIEGQETLTLMFEFENLTQAARGLLAASIVGAQAVVAGEDLAADWRPSWYQAPQSVMVEGPIDVRTILQVVQGGQEQYSPRVEFELEADSPVVIQRGVIRPNAEGSFSGFLSSGSPVQGWSTILGIVVYELVKNGAQGRHNDGPNNKVTVRAWAEPGNGRAVVEIEDNGEGLPLGNPRELTTGKQGTGGIAIREKIIPFVEQHLGGTVEFETRRAEEVSAGQSGTTVRLILPLKASEAGLEEWSSDVWEHLTDIGLNVETGPILKEIIHHYAKHGADAQFDSDEIRGRWEQIAAQVGQHPDLTEAARPVVEGFMSKELPIWDLSGVLLRHRKLDIGVLVVGDASARRKGMPQTKQLNRALPSFALFWAGDENRGWNRPPAVDPDWRFLAQGSLVGFLNGDQLVVGVNPTIGNPQTLHLHDSLVWRQTERPFGFSSIRSRGDLLPIGKIIKVELPEAKPPITEAVWGGVSNVPTPTELTDALARVETVRLEIQQGAKLEDYLEHARQLDRQQFSGLEETTLRDWINDSPEAFRLADENTVVFKLEPGTELQIPDAAWDKYGRGRPVRFLYGYRAFSEADVRQGPMLGLIYSNEGRFQIDYGEHELGGHTQIQDLAEGHFLVIGGTDVDAEGVNLFLPNPTGVVSGRHVAMQREQGVIRVKDYPSTYGLYLHEDDAYELARAGGVLVAPDHFPQLPGGIRQPLRVLRFGDPDAEMVTQRDQELTWIDGQQYERIPPGGWIQIPLDRIAGQPNQQMQVRMTELHAVHPLLIRLDKNVNEPADGKTTVEILDGQTGQLLHTIDGVVAGIASPEVTFGRSSSSTIVINRSRANSSGAVKKVSRLHGSMHMAVEGIEYDGPVLIVSDGAGVGPTGDVSSRGTFFERLGPRMGPVIPEPRGPTPIQVWEERMWPALETALGVAQAQLRNELNFEDLRAFVTTDQEGFLPQAVRLYRQAVGAPVAGVDLEDLAGGLRIIVRLYPFDGPEQAKIVLEGIGDLSRANHPKHFLDRLRAFENQIRDFAGSQPRPFGPPQFVRLLEPEDFTDSQGRILDVVAQRVASAFQPSQQVTNEATWLLQNTTPASIRAFLKHVHPLPDDDHNFKRNLAGMAGNLGRLIKDSARGGNFSYGKPGLTVISTEDVSTLADLAGNAAHEWTHQELRQVGSALWSGQPGDRTGAHEGDWVTQSANVIMGQWVEAEGFGPMTWGVWGVGPRVSRMLYEQGRALAAQPTGRWVPALRELDDLPPSARFYAQGVVIGGIAREIGEEQFRQNHTANPFRVSMRLLGRYGQDPHNAGWQKLAARLTKYDPRLHPPTLEGFVRTARNFRKEYGLPVSRTGLEEHVQNWSGPNGLTVHTVLTNLVEGYKRIPDLSVQSEHRARDYTTVFQNLLPDKLTAWRGQGIPNYALFSRWGMEYQEIETLRPGVPEHERKQLYFYDRQVDEFGDSETLLVPDTANAFLTVLLYDAQQQPRSEDEQDRILEYAQSFLAHPQIMVRTGMVSGEARSLIEASEIYGGGSGNFYVHPKGGQVRAVSDAASVLDEVRSFYAFFGETNVPPGFQEFYGGVAWALISKGDSRRIDFHFAPWDMAWPNFGPEVAMPLAEAAAFVRAFPDDFNDVITSATYYPGEVRLTLQSATEDSEADIRREAFPLNEEDQVQIMVSPDDTAVYQPRFRLQIVKYQPTGGLEELPESAKPLVSTLFAADANAATRYDTLLQLIRQEINPRLEEDDGRLNAFIPLLGRLYQRELRRSDSEADVRELIPWVLGKIGRPAVIGHFSAMLGVSSDRNREPEAYLRSAYLGDLMRIPFDSEVQLDQAIELLGQVAQEEGGDPEESVRSEAQEFLDAYQPLVGHTKALWNVTGAVEARHNAAEQLFLMLQLNRPFVTSASRGRSVQLWPRFEWVFRQALAVETDPDQAVYLGRLLTDQAVRDAQGNQLGPQERDRLQAALAQAQNRFTDVPQTRLVQMADQVAALPDPSQSEDPAFELAYPELDIEVAGFLEVGEKVYQQDDYITVPILGSDGTPIAFLVVIADGVGGAPQGDVASRLAVRGLAHLIKQDQFVDLIETYAASPDDIPLSHPIITEVSFAVTELQNFFLGTGIGMESAFNILLLVGNLGIYSHRGDSRIYHQRGNEITLLTQDHNEAWDSAVAKMKSGDSLPEGTTHLDIAKVAIGERGHARVGMIFGSSGNLPLQVEALILQPGDRFGLATDGVSGRARVETIVAELGDGTRPITEAAEAIRQAAQEGSDNRLWLGVTVGRVPVIGGLEEVISFDQLLLGDGETVVRTLTLPGLGTREFVGIRDRQVEIPLSLLLEQEEAGGIVVVAQPNLETPGETLVSDGIFELIFPSGRRDEWSRSIPPVLRQLVDSNGQVASLSSLEKSELWYMDRGVNIRTGDPLSFEAWARQRGSLLFIERRGHDPVPQTIGRIEQASSEELGRRLVLSLLLRDYWNRPEELPEAWRGLLRLLTLVEWRASNSQVAQDIVRGFLQLASSTPELTSEEATRVQLPRLVDQTLPVLETLFSDSVLGTVSRGIHDQLEPRLEVLKGGLEETEAELLEKLRQGGSGDALMSVANTLAWRATPRAIEGLYELLRDRSDSMTQTGIRIIGASGLAFHGDPQHLPAFLEALGWEGERPLSWAAIANAAVWLRYTQSADLEALGKAILRMRPGMIQAAQDLQQVAVLEQAVETALTGIGAQGYRLTLEDLFHGRDIGTEQLMADIFTGPFPEQQIFSGLDLIEKARAPEQERKNFAAGQLALANNDPYVIPTLLEFLRELLASDAALVALDLASTQAVVAVVEGLVQNLNFEHPGMLGQAPAVQPLRLEAARFLQEQMSPEKIRHPEIRQTVSLAQVSVQRYIQQFGGLEEAAAALAGAPVQSPFRALIGQIDSAWLMGQAQRSPVTDVTATWPRASELTPAARDAGYDQVFLVRTEIPAAAVPTEPIRLYVQPRLRPAIEENLRTAQQNGLIQYVAGLEEADLVIGDWTQDSQPHQTRLEVDDATVRHVTVSFLFQLEFQDLLIPGNVIVVGVLVQGDFGEALLIFV